MKWWSLLTEGLFFLMSGGIITNAFMKAYLNKHKDKE